MPENIEEILQANRDLAEQNMKFKWMLSILGSIFFYGDFVAETKNERDLEAMLIETGFRFRTEEEVIAALADNGGAE